MEWEECEGEEWEGDSFAPRSGPPTFCRSTPMVVVVVVI